MELAPAAGWQLRSCSSNNSRCLPAHLSSIDPDPIPIQYQIQSGQWLARRCQIESNSQYVQPTTETPKLYFMPSDLMRVASLLVLDQQ